MDKVISNVLTKYPQTFILFSGYKLIRLTAVVYSFSETPFMVGDQYANMNPFVLSIAIIWHKWHNIVADRVKGENPNATDEFLFRRSKSNVIGYLQSIAFYEWLPNFINLES